MSLFLLLVLPLVLIPAFALGINPPLLHEARTALQNAADAAALAAAQTLVEERGLLNDTTSALVLLSEAREEGKRYARRNIALGKPLELVTTPRNCADEDLVFGSVPPLGPKVFTAARTANLSTPLWKTVNAVHVSAKRTRERKTQVPLIGGTFFGLQPVDVVAVVTVRIDRHVVGFRARRGHTIPLAPIALFSDPSDDPARHSWEFQVEKHGGTDQWRYDRARRQLVPDAGGDRLFEMTAHLGTPEMAGPKGPKGHLPLTLPAPGGIGGDKGGPSHPAKHAHAGKINAALLQLGTVDAAGLARQLRTGVTLEDLQDLGGQLLLAPTNQLPLPGTLWGPTPGRSEAGQLQNALEEVQSRGECRIWPLFTHIDSTTRTPVITGFVAARIARVDSPGPHGGLSFVLQPCMTSTTTALIDASSRGGAGAVKENPYVCKVRIVQ